MRRFTAIIILGMFCLTQSIPAYALRQETGAPSNATGQLGHELQAVNKASASGDVKDIAKVLGFKNVKQYVQDSAGVKHLLHAAAWLAAEKGNPAQPALLYRVKTIQGTTIIAVFTDGKRDGPFAEDSARSKDYRTVSDESQAKQLISTASATGKAELVSMIIEDPAKAIDTIIEDAEYDLTVSSVIAKDVIVSALVDSRFREEPQAAWNLVAFIDQAVREFGLVLEVGKTGQEVLANTGIISNGNHNQATADTGLSTDQRFLSEIRKIKETLAKLQKDITIAKQGNSTENLKSRTNDKPCWEQLEQQYDLVCATIKSFGVSIDSSIKRPIAATWNPLNIALGIVNGRIVEQSVSATLATRYLNQFDSAVKQLDMLLDSVIAKVIHAQEDLDAAKGSLRAYEDKEGKTGPKCADLERAVAKAQQQLNVVTNASAMGTVAEDIAENLSAEHMIATVGITVVDLILTNVKWEDLPDWIRTKIKIDSLVVEGDIEGTVDIDGQLIERYLREKLTDEDRERLFEEVIGGGPAYSTARVWGQITRDGKSRGSFVSSANHDDTTANVLVPDLEADTVRVDASRIASSSKPTAKTLIFEYGDGKRSFLHNAGASADLTFEMFKQAVESGAFDNREVVEFGGVELGCELMDHLAEAIALLRARETVTGRRFKIVLDTVVDPAHKWKEFNKATDYSILKEIDVLLTNMDEGGQIYADAQTDDLQEARKIAENCTYKDLIDFFSAKGAKAVFLKMGSLGSVVKTSEDSVFGVAAYKHMPVLNGLEQISGTGTGDAYSAALIYGMAFGWDPVKTAVFGTVLGGLCLEHKGGTLGPNGFKEAREKMEELLAQSEVQASINDAVSVKQSIFNARVREFNEAFTKSQLSRASNPDIRYRVDHNGNILSIEATKTGLPVLLAKMELPFVAIVKNWQEQAELIKILKAVNPDFSKYNVVNLEECDDDIQAALQHSINSLWRFNSINQSNGILKLRYMCATNDECAFVIAPIDDIEGRKIQLTENSITSVNVGDALKTVLTTKLGIVGLKTTTDESEIKDNKAAYDKALALAKTVAQANAGGTVAASIGATKPMAIHDKVTELMKSAAPATVMTENGGVLRNCTIDGSNFGNALLLSQDGQQVSPNLALPYLDISEAITQAQKTNPIVFLGSDDEAIERENMQLKKQTAIGIAETEEAAAVMKKYIAEKYALLEANIFICIVDPSADGAAEKIETFVNIEHEGTDLIFISEALDDMVRELGRTENIIHTDRKLFIPTADTKDEQANLSAFRDFLLRTSV